MSMPNVQPRGRAMTHMDAHHPEALDLMSSWNLPPEAEAKMTKREKIWLKEKDKLLFTAGVVNVIALAFFTGGHPYCVSTVAFPVCIIDLTVIVRSYLSTIPSSCRFYLPCASTTTVSARTNISYWTFVTSQTSWCSLTCGSCLVRS
jgi:hypothetical protein